MKNKGFTLFETVIAMLILSSGILLLQHSWSTTVSRQKKIQILDEMSALLERKMVEVDIEFSKNSPSSIPEEKSGDFGEEYPQYEWKLKSQELELPDIGAALTAQSGGAAQELLTVMNQFQNHLKKSVREVKVTVLYKHSKKNLEASATRYFVDFDQEVSGLTLGAGQ